VDEQSNRDIRSTVHTAGQLSRTLELIEEIAFLVVDSTAPLYCQRTVLGYVRSRYLRVQDVSITTATVTVLHIIFREYLRPLASLHS